MTTTGGAFSPITKTQFKLGLDCLLKLRHARPFGERAKAYPQSASQNDMLRLLAEGGGAVEALWRQREPGDIGPVGREAAATASMEAIRSAVERSRASGKMIPLYEITIMHDGFLARIDLLRVSEAKLQIIEMKAKSVVSADAADEDNEILGKISSKKTGDNRTILKPWIPYLQDLAFQKVLLGLWLETNGREVGLRPDTDIEPGMILVNKRGSAKNDDTLGNFKTDYRIDKHGHPRAHVSYVGAGCPNTELLVEMTGMPAIIKRIEENAHADDQAFKDKGISDCMEMMANVIRKGQWPDAASRLTSSCKNCEFKTSGSAPNGFDECWGSPRPVYHVLTLPRVTPKQVASALEQADSRSALASDVPEADVTQSQMPVWDCLQTTPPTPIVSSQFKNADSRNMMLRKSSSDEPCYFLDFECALYPIPRQVGGKPYEMAPFQFEAHKLPSFAAGLDQRVRLKGFLDLTSDDPRTGFLRALRAQLGDHGVIYHWHHYEETVLKKLREWLTSTASDVPLDAAELVKFIDSLLGDSTTKQQGRLCDLLKVANKAFYHPSMLGSYSIKKVLPVAWEQATIREHFVPGHHCAGDPETYGHPQDPYLALPSLPQSFLEAVGGVDALREIECAVEENDPGLPDAMKNGGMAMLFYHYVRMFGGADRPEIVAQFKNYCGLDSAAMVMVFRYMTDIVPGFPADTSAFPEAND